MTIGDIERNDLKACAAYYQARGRKITAEEAHILRLLQDDPADFDRMARAWRVQKPEFKL